MEDNSAAAMIRRFREGKPSSREEREKKKQTTGVDKLWYENDGERPRSLAVEPSMPPARPNSALRSIRQPVDYMTESTNSLFKGSKLGDTFGVDDLIEKEIRQLEQQVMEQDRRTNARLDLGSFNPARSLDIRSSMGSLRDSSDGYRLTGRNLRSSVSPMRLSGDLLRSSVETLGTTGFRGLLLPHLKLDGHKEEEAPKEEKTADEMAELNKNLEAFLKSMQADHPPRNPYFPEGVDETLGQIANKVHNDMMDFQHLFGDKHAHEDAEAEAQKTRDEQMREEGRKEARERQLLELDVPASHPLEFFGVWDGQRQHPAVVEPSAVPYLQQHQQHQQQHFQHPPQGPHPVSPHVHFAPIPSSSGGGAAAAGGVTDYGVRLETDLAALRLSDDSMGSSVGGSPFPQYHSTILSPEASGGASSGGPLPTIREGFPVGNQPAEGGGPEGGKSTTTETNAAAAPTLRDAGVLGGLPQQQRLVHPAQMITARGSQGRGFTSSAGKSLLCSFCYLQHLPCSHF